ncbi:MAG: VWA domain-containing protein, partial [Chloroflexota bacterium]|nr:VWA domain-containing protein [Chloroflexota bacterium]
MGLLAPLGLSLAALALPIIALYLLKIRRREQVVSSTLLWDRLARDLEANAPWQRFRPNWLLLLQLLALAALVLALSRPFLRVDAALADSVALVIDTSASMGATDIEGGRIAAAKRLADDLIDGLPSGGQMLLIAAGAQARVIQPMTTDRQALSDAIADMQVEQGGAAIDDALMLAVAAAARLPRSEIMLISDGGVDPGLLRNLAVPARALSVELNEPE